jgi:tetratricopeptide (TPR) repeat protein
VRIQILLDLRRHDEVLKSSEALLAQGKPSAELYALRAAARTKLQDYAGAIQDDTMALGLQLDQAPLLVRRGWLYLISKAPELALRDFEKALVIAPRDSAARVSRGSARVALGDHRGAVADAQAALTLGPPSALLSYRAARIYAQAASAVAPEARRTERQAVFLANRYLDRAVALATEAIRQINPEQRAAFWRDQIQADPALRSIARRVKPPTASLPEGR